MEFSRAGEVAWAVANDDPTAPDLVRDLWAEAPGELASVVEALVATPLGHCTLLQVAVDHLATDDLPALAAAMSDAVANGIDPARSVLGDVAHELALQAPETLRPYPDLAAAASARTFPRAETDEGIDESEPMYHLQFPPGFLIIGDASTQVGLPPSPTWSLDTPVAGTGRFGGTAADPCALCGNPLHLLVGFDQVPPGIRAPAQVVTCLSCLGWSTPTLYFAHHDDGGVQPIGDDLQPREPEFPAEPFPQTPISFRPTPRRWRRQEWNPLQNLHRLGGPPVWVQSEAIPDCPMCHADMRFLLELDSLEIQGGPWWLWGSGGLVYVFTCDPCQTTATFWQCS